MRTMAFPDRARVVIVGGGITGASLAYHLAHEGWTDTLLVEKAELTSGSTWHAAGQVTHSVSSYTLATFRKYACELYAALETETGVATTWHQSGSFRVAYDPVEVDWLRGQLGLAEYVGNEMHWVDKAFIAEKHPFYDVDKIVGAVYTPDDGHVDPSGATNAMIAAARSMGVLVSRRNRVLDINRRPATSSRPTGGGFDVVTEQGTVEAEHVVNAAGCYAHQVAAMVGLSVPMANALHTYLITTPVPEFAALDQELPVVRDDYLSGYVRQEQESGLIGIYEQTNAEAAWPEGPDWSLENPLFPADYDRIGFWLERAFERVPILADHGIKQVIRGAIAHTPDGEPLLGPSGVPDFWQLAGVQVGIADGPGLGRELARWMVHGETNVSLRGYDARRFGFVPADDALRYGRIKGTEDYEFRHQTPVPGLEHPAERPYRSNPLVERFRAGGAVFTQVYGWERPKWYPTVAGLPQEDVVAFRHTDWFEPVRAEVQAVRERVGILDSTAFAKFELVGPHAAAVLDQLTTNTVPAVGRIGLTYLLTPRGRIEGEMTVTRLPDDGANQRFYLVSAAVGEQKDREYFETHWPAGAEAELRVVSGDYGVITVAGPRSRELLSRCTAADLGNDTFAWLRAREIDVAGVTTRALRVGFVGELGWELHLPTSDLGIVYDALWAAGEDLGVANVGNHALDSLRMEKGYRISRDLTHDVGPDEAGLDFFVKTDHRAKGDFVGRDALLARRAVAASGERPYRWRLCHLAVDTDGAEVHGSDAVYPVGNPVGGGGGPGTPIGRPIGLVTTGAYGYTVDQGLAFAYLAPEHASPGTPLSVRVVGEHRPARVLDEAVYDPSSSRLRM